MKTRIYNLINQNEGRYSCIYDTVMIIAIAVSLVPLLFHKEFLIFAITDKVTVTIFIIDYVFRLLTANIKYNCDSAVSYLRYPLSPMAIVDLLSILPSFTFFSSTLKLLRVARLIRMVRVIRVVKFVRYSKSIKILVRVFSESKESLLAVGGFALAYILISGLIIFNVEPQSFDTYFDAVYWATVSLTTVGYGDLYPITTIGRSMAMISSFFGIAIVALPAGVITAGYLKELEDEN